jgi:hypothetical protein
MKSSVFCFIHSFFTLPVHGFRWQKKLATSDLPFQGFEGFIRTQNKNNFSNPESAFLENPLFVLWLTLIMDLVDPGTLSEIF